MGVFYEFGGLGNLLDCLNSNLEKNDKIKILLVGDGPAKATLEAKIHLFGLHKNVFITGYQPFELMPKYLEIADVCINVWPINSRTDNIFSAKIVQYLACGKPVLSSALDGIMRALPEAETGVQYFQKISKLVNQLTEFSNNPGLCDHLGDKGRKYIRENNSVMKIALSVEKHLQEMVFQNVP